MLATRTQLQPAVHFREFPFGTAADPSMHDFTAEQPWPDQDRATAYLRQGVLLGLPLGADLPDYFEPGTKANPQVGERRVGGATPMTDGVWFWPAGLIHFVERHNVRLPNAFLAHAAAQQWHVDAERVRRGSYDYDY